MILRIWAIFCPLNALLKLWISQQVYLGLYLQEFLLEAIVHLNAVDTSIKK